MAGRVFSGGAAGGGKRARQDSCAYVRNHYGVPARVGMRVRLADGKEGVICRSATDQHYIHVRFDGARHTVPCHPTDGVTYITGEA